MLNCVVVLFLIFWGTSILLSIVAVSIYIPTDRAYGFFFLHILAHTCDFLSYRHSYRCEMVSHYGFDLHFPDDQWCWVSSCAIGHLYIFFGKMPIQVFCPFFNWIVFLYWVVWVPYTFLDISFLSDILFANIFSHSLGCLFIFWWFTFVCQSFSIWLGYICLFLLLFPLPEEIATKTRE